ncbi:MAG: T9SS type A sorting domain-containing protein [Saprospiraceae bacterium]|nr:T9SS type A sorting domain-containing protein [Saprospiraceae bacterium]
MVNQSFHSKLKLSIAFILLIGIVFGMQAQKHFDYNWLFGYGTGIPDSTNPFGGVIMSFTNNKVSFIPQARNFEFSWQANSFSSDNGELLYMSNGCLMADNNAEVIKNGDSLGYGRIWGVNCPKNQPLAQGGIFINLKNDTNTLIFLHTILDTIGNGQKAFLKCVYETKINVLADSIISKNKIILYDTLYSGITAIPDINPTKWWVIIPVFRSNEIYTFRYSEKGVELSLKQRVGIEHIPMGSGGAQSVISPNGKMFAMYSPLNGVQIFDFDRATGVLSNFRHFDLTFTFNTAGGCVFSPNSQFLYISNPTEVIQIDLFETNTNEAIDTVGVFDNFFDPYPTTYLEMALGPDCRIYISTYGGNRYLHVIVEPNKKGKECNLINRGLRLPTRNSFVTPNFPHYRVDDLYPCDSTITIPLNTAVENEYKFKEADIMIYPNPASSTLFLHDIKGKINSQVQLRLIDLNGKVFFNELYNSIQEEIKIPIQGLQPGMFIIQIIDQKGNYWTDKFIKE